MSEIVMHFDRLEVECEFEEWREDWSCKSSCPYAGLCQNGGDITFSDLDIEVDYQPPIPHHMVGHPDSWYEGCDEGYTLLCATSNGGQDVTDLLEELMGDDWFFEVIRSEIDDMVMCSMSDRQPGEVEI